MSMSASACLCVYLSASVCLCSSFPAPCEMSSVGQSKDSCFCALSRRCYECNEIGHMARDCRLRQGGARGGGGGRGGGR